MTEFDNTAPPVEARGIVSQFGTNVVHENLDFRLNQGEIVGLVGGSGSGKSVLMNTLLGLKEPDGGVVRFFGQDRRQLDPKERAQIDNEMGVLFQGGALFSSLTVRENIMIPLREHTDLSVPLMRELADMKVHMVGLPPNAATLYPSDLSGGMKKRAGLARALALDPKLLFLDEPTAGLDPIGATAFDNLILGLRDALDLTVLMITHDLDSLYAICDRIAVLVDKCIPINDKLDAVLAYDHPWVQEYFGGARSRAAQSAGRK
ncbi:ABC transporter ATP-binding protein [Litorimonas sp. RW-G-Af-16]|uniref:ABC transporter ATP-binding protein n=1 Tax=Litorimonas sp. RW-G-Af-16 TaxID=3241168 RepID=UPI00390C875F